MKKQTDKQLNYPVRSALVAFGFAAFAVLLAYRIVDLHVLRKDFLQDEGDARSIRVVETVAHRGMILDRNGEPLAISTPVDSVWANPQKLVTTRDRWPALAHALGMKTNQLEQILAGKANREFVYLKRQIHPDRAQQILSMHLPGVSLRREYRRYYPAGEVCGHLLGFTNIDDVGQEGVELEYQDWLQGKNGSKRVLKDLYGQTIEDIESIKVAEPGKDLYLSIDRRLQYLAYRELKAAVQKHNARSGSAVLLDVNTGEVLAIVNQPSFNPNNRRGLTGNRYRNRAVTDVFEPGSTIKPFTVAAALKSGLFTPDSMIETGPGTMKIGHNLVRDTHNHGTIDVRRVIQKSSNIGASKLALAIPPEAFWQVLNDAGFGNITDSGLPGESSGILTLPRHWREFERATLSFGYGLSTTTLQLAQAYSIFATNGKLRKVTFQRTSAADVPPAKRIIPAKIAREVRNMLEMAVHPGGTGMRAQIQGYRVAGKTGTVHVSTQGGYEENGYDSVFAGFAPASHPRLVMVVMIKEPRDGEYYGGVVAAPVFARVMAGALRLMNIPPDDLNSLKPRMAELEKQHRLLATLDDPVGGDL